MKIGIYAIIDKKTEDLIGGLQLHKHPASAIRTFTDIGLDKQTLLNRHPEDFDLVKLGELTDQNQIQPDYNVIITGSAWAASQAQPNET